MRKIFYPPQPFLISITQPLFQKLEMNKSVVAELKYNGDHLVLKRLERPAKRFEFWTRHGEPFKKYRPPDILIENLSRLKWEGDCVLDGELLHNKSPAKKDTIILFDVLAWKGEVLEDQRFLDRRLHLIDIFAGQEFPNLQFAPQWRGKFKKVFNEYTRKKGGLYEGLVLKNLEGKLKLGWTGPLIADWMWKVRKPSGRYKF